MRHSNMLHIGEVVVGLATLPMSDEVELGDSDSPGVKGVEAGSPHGGVAVKPSPYSQPPSATDIVSDNNPVDPRFEISSER